MASEKATYSHGHHASVVQSHARRTAANSAAFLLPHITPTANILDVGCGPGSITIGLARAAPQGHTIGCDVVSDVINQATALAQAENIPNLTFQTADANHLPFDDASFDIVYCHQTLQHVGDPVQILRELRRVTKPGGIVAARDADYAAFAWWPESEGLTKWATTYQKIAEVNGAQPNAGRYLPEWARRAGFAADRVVFTWDSWNYQGPEAKAFGTSWIDRTLHSGYATTARKFGLASEEELVQISTAWRDWSESENPVIVIPNGEILCRV